MIVQEGEEWNEAIRDKIIHVPINQPWMLQAEGQEEELEKKELN